MPRLPTAIFVLSVAAAAPASAATEDASASLQWSTTQQLEAATYAHDNGAIPGGAEVRRSRLSVSGSLSGAWQYRLEYEFAQRPGFTDAYLLYHGQGGYLLTIGQAKQPFGFEASAGDRNGVFMERALPYALVPKRAPGISLFAHGLRWTAGAGVYGEPLGTVQAGDEGVDVAARVTGTPVLKDEAVLHVGLSALWREPAANNSSSVTGPAFSTVRFRSKPESDVATQRLVDTGEIRAVSDYQAAGAELASRRGPLSFQAEYDWVQVGRSRARALHFSGWYAQLAYTLTGESRPYRADRGTLEAVQAARRVGRGGPGAVEVALRLSALDLRDDTVNGGLERDAAAAVNWYLNPALRVSANFVRVLRVRGGPMNGLEPSAYQLRLQLAL